MRESQPISDIFAIERPRCINCQEPRVLLSKIEAGPKVFDRRTFECQKCGGVYTVVNFKRFI
jgi:hypothetical protein